MDFSFTDEQQAVVESAARILESQATKDQQLDAGTRSDARETVLWQQLAGAGLLGVVVPSEHGGLGLGFVELALLLEQVGRSAAQVPVLPSALAAMTLAKFGTDAQRSTLLPDIAAGDVVVAPALIEALGEPLVPWTSARRTSSGWTLDGLKTCVPAGLSADLLLVSARVNARETGLFLVDPTSTGVARVGQETMTGVTEAQIELRNVEVPSSARVGDRAALQWCVERATVAVSMVMAGICGEAVRLTADYVKSREQFERPIASFQAVRQRLADSFIDATSIRMTALRAAWLLSDGDLASKEVAVAKFYAADAGPRIARATVHLHGGIGVDRNYPLHRYYLWAKHLELVLGGAERQLRILGACLAKECVNS
ncbi:acyl-CoA dehydrogenase family protein [Nocardia sp. CA-136227]|uniref:acyl-CoA dehydrogenase family protein n=1 Tax=Nocardia sp. CA-136227 TaxID=3239979 RepID=UPI003D98AED3